MACIACGGTSIKPLFTTSSPDGKLDTPFTVAQCTACGMGFTQPLPSAHELKALYHHEYHAPSTRRVYTRITDALRSLFMAQRFRMLPPLGSRSRLLDIGCGNGEFISFARPRIAAALGIEPNFTSTDPFIKRGINELAPDAIFDCITMWHVLEHVEDPVSILRSLAARLAPGGTLFISVPNFASLDRALGGTRWFHLDAPRHVFHFTPQSLTLLVRQAGLQVTSVEQSANLYTLFGFLQTLLNITTRSMNTLYYHLKQGSRTPPLLLARDVLLSIPLLACAVVLTVIARAVRRTDSFEVVCVQP